MDTALTPLDSLIEQSGLPSYILEYFDRIGLLELSSFEANETSENDANLDLAKQIAALRSLGFSFGQITSLLEEGGIQLPENGFTPYMAERSFENN